MAPEITVTPTDSADKTTEQAPTQQYPQPLAVEVYAQRRSSGFFTNHLQNAARDAVIDPAKQVINDFRNLPLSFKLLNSISLSALTINSIAMLMDVLAIVIRLAGFTGSLAPSESTNKLTKLSLALVIKIVIEAFIEVSLIISLFTPYIAAHAAEKGKSLLPCHNNNSYGTLQESDTTKADDSNIELDEVHVRRHDDEDSINSEESERVDTTSLSSLAS